MSGYQAREAGKAGLWVAGVFIACLVIAGLIFGAWKLGWIFTQANVSQQAKVIQNSYNTQEGYQTQIINDIAGVNGAADSAQAISDGNQACAEALQLHPQSVAVPASISSWVSDNCAAGSVSATSPLRK